MDPVNAADAYHALFGRVLPEEIAAQVATSGLAVDLADVLNISTRLYNALAALDPDTSRLEDVVASLDVVHQEFVIHAPFHLESLSGYLTDLIVQLEEATDSIEDA
jgi:hypothetical protein